MRSVAELYDGVERQEALPFLLLLQYRHSTIIADIYFVRKLTQYMLPYSRKCCHKSRALYDFDRQRV